MLLSELSSLFTPSLHVGDEVVVQATPLANACPDIFINSMIRESTCVDSEEYRQVEVDWGIAK